MARFIVRVQVNGDPSAFKYDELHKAMDKFEYERTIQGTKNRAYLPHAEYFKESSNQSCTAVRDEVKHIVKSVFPDQKFQLLCSEIKTWSAWGLENA